MERNFLMRCTLNLGELPYKLFFRLLNREHPVTRGLQVQEFVARDVWEDWEAEIGHGTQPDIRLERQGEVRNVEVKYFYWDAQRFYQVIDQALRQHAGFVPYLVLVSLVKVFPITKQAEPLYRCLEESTPSLEW